MKFYEIIDDGLDYCADHKPLVLSCLGAVGVLGTIALSIHAGKKVQQKIEEVDARIESERAAGKDISESDVRKEHLKSYFPAVIPAIGVGIVTIACNVASYNIMAKDLMAVSTAYIWTSKAFENHKLATKKILGEKEKEIQIERQKQEMQEKPMPKELENKVKNDYERAEKDPTPADLRYGIKPVWHDSITGQYIYATRDTIRDAIEEFNVEIRTSDDEDFHSWNDFLINIPGADYNTVAGTKIGFYKADFPDGVKFDLNQSCMADNGINVAEIRVRNDKYNVLGVCNRDKNCGDGIWYNR